MNRKEFIETAAKMGYCTKNQAASYAKERDDFTERDLEEAWRFAERQQELIRFDSEHDEITGRTTKRYAEYDSRRG